MKPTPEANAASSALSPAATPSSKAIAAPKSSVASGARPVAAKRATRVKPNGTTTVSSTATVAKPSAASSAVPEEAREADKSSDPSKQQTSTQPEAKEKPANSPVVVAHRRRYWWQRLGSGAASAIVHAGLFVALMIWTMALPQEAPRYDLQASVSDTVTPEAVKPQPIEQQVDIPQQTTMAAAAIPMGSPIDAQSIAITNDASPDTGDLGTVGPVLGEMSQLFGADGSALAEIGLPGGSTEATFFGVRSQARRIVYICDHSGSMKGGKMETVMFELMRSLEGLKPSQDFYIIMFSSKAYPMFYPSPYEGMLPATDKSRYLVKQWLDIVPTLGGTSGKDALKIAMSLKPDVIFLLGDGAFGDDTTQVALGMRDFPVTIHTIGLGIPANSKAAGELQTIAQAFKGTYTDIQIPPEMIAYAKKVQRATSWPSSFIPRP